MSKDLNIISSGIKWDQEEFKRPTHPDFMTALELKNSKFNGIRLNSLAQQQELWIMGELLYYQPLALWNQLLWDEKMAEALAIKNVETLSMDNFKGAAKNG